MEAAKTTEIFLDRVRKKHAVSTTINGLYLVFALLVFTYLLGNLASYYGSQPREYLVPFILALVFLLGYVLFPHFRKLVPGLSRDEAALLAEKHYPELKNSLIKSWQLQRHLVDPEAEKFLSLAFVRETVRQTSAQIEGFSAETVISQKETNRSRNILLAGLILTAIPVLILPDFFSRGYNNLTQIPAQASLSPVAIEKNITLPVQPYVVEDIRLKLNYPAYMRMPSETLQQAEVHAFPGTEVRIQATSNRSVQGAELILHGSNRYSMTVKENLNLAGNFMVKDQGYYQFGLKVGEGSKVTLPVKHPITLKKDEFPKVSLFPSHPKPVYYEND
ncbi:MAG: hypothetical protein VYC17_04625, partial [Nitrospinota bacterium]|nr:hypothetical protein [Nitrospinota bacterium]